MSKVIVKPLKKTGLLNTNGDWLSHMRPSVTKETGLLQQRIASKEFRVLASELRDEATDEEFAKTFAESEGNERLAVESFESQFSEDPMKAETEEQKTVRLKREQADKEKADKAQKEIDDKAKADAKKEADAAAAAEKTDKAIKETNATREKEDAARNNAQNTSLAPTTTEVQSLGLPPAEKQIADKQKEEQAKKKADAEAAAKVSPTVKDANQKREAEDKARNVAQNTSLAPTEAAIKPQNAEVNLGAK